MFIEFIEPVSSQFELNYLSLDVKGVINRLETSKSCGLDKIPVGILKDSNEIVAPYLTRIYNCSISTGIFQMSGKWPGCHQFSSQGANKIEATTDQFPFYLS